MGRLDGQVAFITGGARGQGRAIAAKFAAEGADIVISDLCAQIGSVPYEMATAADLQETAALIEGAGRRCIAAEVDVRDLAALEALVARTVEELGRIDVVCANAGIVNFHPLWELEEDVWDDMIDVNLTGVFKTVKAVAGPLMEAKHGSIILTSSVNGKEAGPEMSHYVAAKHGVLGLMRSFAYELGPYGIRVNSVLPGPILSPMADNEPTRSWIFRRSGATREDYLEATRNWHLLRGRPSLPASVIADAMIWLASDESAQVTGLEVAVDAGHMVLPGMNMDPVKDPALGGFDYDANALNR
ncbi:MAG TPA: mycofactocin-coupled SDR family oxidoreductase [Solirubrobacterales bacterium]|nr:mycofactocin-coupled SDR family oxidoreductase [Solirubrobacterales bacterium]